MTGDIQNMFNTAEVYLLFIFFIAGYLMVDHGLVTANAEINTWMFRQKEIAAYKKKKEALKDLTVTKRKVAAYQSKCAFDR